MFPSQDDELFAAPAGWAGLRSAGAALSAADAGAFVAALSLGRWLLDAPFCPACGTLTILGDSGWSRRCPHCGRQHFPRTDPAVIVAITSAEDPDLLLLGSNALWGADRFSCFAGFVEAGESLEAAVRREVSEESGVDVGVVSLPRLAGLALSPFAHGRLPRGGARRRSGGGRRRRDRGGALVHAGRDRPGARGPTAMSPSPVPASIAHRLIADWHAERA